MQQSLMPFLDSLPVTLSWKEKVAYVAAQLLNGPHDALAPVEHIFENCLYIRKLRIPAHRLFIGRAHLLGHECALLSGSIIVLAEGYQQRMDAPQAMLTTPGFHMIVYTLTDIVAQTAHPNPTNSCDWEALEAQIFEPAEVLAKLGRDVRRRLT